MKTKVKLETEKEVTIDSLTNASIVGFIDVKGRKWQSVFVSNNQWQFITYDGGVTNNANFILSSNCAGSIKDGIAIFDKDDIVNLFLFDTGKELYQWLAE